MDTPEVRVNLHSKLSNLLQRIDATPVTGKQKLLVYRAGVCPRLMWDLSISQLSLTWVSITLEAEATRFLKRWVGLARSANPAPLYLPKAKGGLGLPSLVVLWKKQQISRACQLISSRDPFVRHVATHLTTKEEGIFHHPSSSSLSTHAKTPCLTTPTWPSGKAIPENASCAVRHSPCCMCSAAVQ